MKRKIVLALITAMTVTGVSACQSTPAADHSAGKQQEAAAKAGGKKEDGKVTGIKKEAEIKKETGSKKDNGNKKETGSKKASGNKKADSKKDAGGKVTGSSKKTDNTKGKKTADKKKQKKTKTDSGSEEQSMTGKLEENKGFMFGLTSDADGKLYLFDLKNTMKKKLDGIQVGDKITVTFKNGVPSPDNTSTEVTGVKKAA